MTWPPRFVAETPVAGIIWMEPKDLNASRMQFSVNSGSTGETGSHHPQGPMPSWPRIGACDQLFPRTICKGVQGREDIRGSVD
jgi:hypothetical protein